jgi:hypothetical protein
MAIERSSLTSVKEDLSSNLSGQLDETQRDTLRRTFEDAGITSEYEDAYDNFGVAGPLAEAADQGDLGDLYEAVYATDPSLRDDLASAASNAFDMSARDAIANHAKQENLGAAYRACARGDADAAAAAVNISGSFNPSSTRECNNLVAEASGYSKGLHEAYKDEDDQSTYTHPEPPQ